MRADRPSATALIVAAGVLRCASSRRSRAMVPPASAAIASAALRRAGAGWGIARWIATTPPGAPLAWLIERLLVPGISMHYVLRKRLIEEAVRRALAEGVSRVVILGAGLDGLGAALAAQGVDVVEVDHPATQDLKRAALEDAGLGRGLRLIPADLAREFPHDLLAGPRCIVIAEGLLMYLEPARLRALVRGPAKRLAPGSRLVMTFLERHGQAPLGFRNGTALVAWWVRQRGEPFTWGIYPTRLKGLLRAAGLEMLDCIDHTELRRRYLRNSELADIPLAEGEFIGIAWVPDRARAGAPVDAAAHASAHGSWVHSAPCATIPPTTPG